jgi:hypothetical protein
LQLICPTPALAQVTGTPGNNAVYDQLGNCCTGSSAFIDARWIQLSDFCDTIHGILTSQNYPASGTVIDARGLNVGNATLTCASSPWGSGNNYVNKPSTILLPPGTITIPSTWIVPSGTLLIGEGTTTASNPSGIEQTTIQACLQASGCSHDFTGGTPILQFGASSGNKGIGVEHPTLNRNNLAVNGLGGAHAGATNAPLSATK